MARNQNSSAYFQTLEKLGYEVLYGQSIMKKDARMGLPSSTTFKINEKRAIQEGVDIKYINIFKDGMTAVAGILKNGDGPTIGIRFDIDALGLVRRKKFIPFFHFNKTLFLVIQDLCMPVVMMDILQWV